MKLKFITITIALLLAVLSSPIEAQEASSEGNSVLQRVKEKVEALKKNPKTYMGTITDKTDTSIQIESIRGVIELISVSDVTHFTKLDKSETEIKFIDLAIGDFVFALGTFGNSEVLNARRVILTSPPTDKRSIIVGKVVSNAKRTLILSTQDNKEYTFSFPTKWKGPEIKEFKAQDLVIVVSLLKDGKETIRTIDFINPKDIP